MQLQRAVAAAVNRHLPSSPAAVQRRHVAGLTVRVRRGFTCNARWYLSFLGRMEEATALVLARLAAEEQARPSEAAGAEGVSFRAIAPAPAEAAEAAAASTADRLVGGSPLAPVVLHLPTTATTAAGASSSPTALGAEFAFLAHLPLTVDMVVEEGHGTKVRPRGRCVWWRVRVRPRGKCLLGRLRVGPRGRRPVWKLSYSISSRHTNPSPSPVSHSSCPAGSCGWTAAPRHSRCVASQ